MLRLFLLLLLFASSLPLAPAYAARTGRAVVTIRLAAEGVEADVRLDRPVSRFNFADHDVVREGDFELLTPGLTLKGNDIAAAAPFRTFRLRIRAAAQERDAKYPTFFSVGGGGVLYAPALKADPAGWRTSLRFRTAPGEILLSGWGPRDEGFVFIGQASLARKERDMVIVSDAETPAWLVETSRAALSAGVATYTAALNTRLEGKPLLIVRQRPGPRKFNVGDVTAGGITSLRFYGDGWKQPDRKAARTIQSFVMHETFHFWNGSLAHHGQTTPTWLHEGGAEYAALLAGLKGGILSDDDVKLRLGEALDHCRLGLQQAGDKGLAAISFLPNQIRYPCGMVLQWAFDLHIRSASGGLRTVLDAWRDTIRAAMARRSKTYSLTDFYAAAGIADPKHFQPLTLLVDENGAARWAALADALDALGARVSQAPTAEGRRPPLLFHLLQQNCRNLPAGTGIGFYTESGRIRLQSPPGCGVLTGDPLLKSVEGGDPFAPDAQTYAAVAQRCAAKQPVMLVTADGRTIAARCDAPLPPAPLSYKVERWMPAAPERH